ncbi:hypothetical protein [Rhodococcoides fascians]|uniref:hypothetical protein n=1 Tax=Rhodococcoides fascians TaxID=1828 RepID=UPI00050C0A38|nr:hypothetical protein [Rhodococcus fascians]
MNMRPGFRIAVSVAVLVLAVGCASTDSEQSPAPDSASPTAASVPNPGAAFEGTYELEQVQQVRADLTPMAPEYRTTTFAVKSYCPQATVACVASALVTYPKIVPLPPPQPIALDYIDGKWALNVPSSGLTCATQDGAPLAAPSWQVAAFEQSEGVDDGSLIAGTATTHAGPPCAKQFTTTYTFTRTGPLDPALNIPPPEAVPALVNSPGSALSGTYSFDLSPLSATNGLSNSPVQATGNYQSFCTRTGDRCVSVIDSTTDVLPMLEWSNGAWTSEATYATASCDDGSGQQQTTIRVSLTNPDPNAAPAQRLSGEIKKIYVGDCPGEVEWSIDATRTGG